MNNYILKKIIRYEKSIILFSITIFMCFYTFKTGQDGNFDLLNYHFFTGYSYVNDRIGDISPANIQTFTHPAVNSLAYFAFDKLLFPYSAWLILFVQLLSIPPLMLIAEEICLAMTGYKHSVEKTLSLILCCISPLWLSELGTSFFSSTTTPLVLWSLYLIIKKNHNDILEGSIAGILMGLALGLKLTNAPFIIGSALAVIAKAAFTDKQKIRFLSSYVIGGVAGVILTSHWYWELWTMWGNPLFPFYNKIFQSPYFDLNNWRDTRWMFHNVREYVKFVTEAVVMTNKTSEVPFKDARLILVSLTPFIFLIKLNKKIKAPILILLTFFYISYLLWALLFAYQRYAIPLEIMYGLIIWIALNQIISNQKIKNLTLILITMFSLWHFNIPDWGHIQPGKTINNPFSVKFSDEFENKPARYLVDGVTVSYVLRYLNPKSEFYGVRFSRQVNELIKTRLKKPSPLPTGIVTTESNIKNLPNIFDEFGLNEKQFHCDNIQTSASRYIVCLVDDERNSSHHNININYTVKSINNTGLVYAQGLSDYEENGRWSIGKNVEWSFANCIRSEKILLSLSGSAYGPNVGKPFSLHVADKTFSFLMKQNFMTLNFSIDNPRKDCINSVVLDIPTPTAPSQLGESEDSRKLGILVEKLTLSEG
ncbi:DUF2029 domain-containing protein [Pantoea agglomerans]|uniref:DUF7024 domain-containing protein n=1 Tax=Enterobacter agglomerans TaxID=549 RepID=UPI001A8FC488|nr:glycosyltransferase 87 family protein [Pantoea agglomerans]MBN9930535.1 DUF2029 domain-containing protein [Pantoea agglomerans]